MISLREMKEKDALLMLEWMHDPDMQKCFQKNMLGTTKEDAIQFCRTAALADNQNNLEGDRHFAIVDENDEYLGTVSLKNIDMRNRSAEYAISTRTKIHGKGIAKTATRLILQKAFEEYKLHRVYLNVLEDNEAAIRLYERSGFVYEGVSRQCLLIDGKYVSLKRYGMLDTELKDMLRIEEE